MARAHVTVWIGGGYAYWQKVLAWLTQRVAK